MIEYFKKEQKYYLENTLDMVLDYEVLKELPTNYIESCLNESLNGNNQNLSAITSKCRSAVKEYDLQNIDFICFCEWCIKQINEYDIDMDKFEKLNNEKLIEGFKEGKNIYK